MLPSLRTFTSVAIILAVFSFGCERPDEPGEPESKSAMDEANARTDFDGKLSIQVNAIEAAGEHSNLELKLENTTDETVEVAKSDYFFASNSADWLAAKDAPETTSVPAGESTKITVTVAMPADKINVLNVGNVRVEVPEVSAEDVEATEAAKPSGKGIQRLEAEPETSGQSN